MLVEMVRRNLNPLADEERFDWLYRRNPAGEARVWLATEGAGGAVMGMVAAFPRRLWVGQDERPGWVMGEFCVSSRYRSLGPAVALQRACLAGIDDGESPLWYDFPSDGMMAVYRRLGVGLPRRMVRLARPLRVNLRVEEMVGSSAVARGVSAVGNALLRLRERGLDADRGIRVAVQKEPFGEEFTALARQVRGRHGVCVSRSREYLSWRFPRRLVGQARGVHGPARRGAGGVRRGGAGGVGRAGG
jgi:hypothetical protein